MDRRSTGFREAFIVVFALAAADFRESFIVVFVLAAADFWEVFEVGTELLAGFLGVSLAGRLRHRRHRHRHAPRHGRHRARGAWGTKYVSGLVGFFGDRLRST